MTTRAQATDPALTCRLLAGEGVPSKDSVGVRFVLTNAGSQVVHVLDWYTPLEGMRSDMFKVTQGSTALAYQGPLIKRGQPRRESYRTIEPGESLARQVDLARYYDFGPQGTYTVALDTRIHDVVLKASELPRARSGHVALELECESLRIEISR